MNQPDHQSLLPTSPPKLHLDPAHLRYLAIAPPKWGKTTFFSGCPNACLLAFESGYASAECPVVVISAWDRSYKARQQGWGEDEAGVVYTSAIEILEELERHNPYSFLILDTLDVAVKLCSDYHCEQAKVDHPSEGGDFGRGWDLLQTSPIRKFWNRITKLGVGVAAITHANERTDKDKFNKDRFRRETSLPTGVQKFVHAQSDVILHGFFGRRRKGQKDRDRIISFDGTDEILAGTRVRRVMLPHKYIVTPPTFEDSTPPWRQWTEFFRNSPAAGEAAGRAFSTLFEGADDETVETVPAEKPTSTSTQHAQKTKTTSNTTIDNTIKKPVLSRR